MFECTFHDVKFFIRLLDAVRELYPVINISCTEDGWRCSSLNELGTLICDMQLDWTFFEYYKCTKACNIVLKVGALLKQLKVGSTVSHGAQPTRLHVRYHPTNLNSKVHFRLDFGLLKLANSMEFEFPQAEDVPKDVILPEVGEMQRLQFGASEFKKILGEMHASGFHDTMKLLVKPGSVQFLAEGEQSKAAIKVEHDSSSAKLQQHVLCDHLELETNQECLCSLTLLTAVAKAGGSLGEIWEMQLMEQKPLVFRLPLYVPPQELDKRSERGREGSALKFFTTGFKKNSSANEQFEHLDDPQNVPDERPAARETCSHDLANPIDPQFDLTKDAAVEAHPHFGVRRGIITFYLPPKKKIGGETSAQFLRAESTPLAQKRRNRLEREQDGILDEAAADKKNAGARKMNSTYEGPAFGENSDLVVKQKLAGAEKPVAENAGGKAKKNPKAKGQPEGKKKRGDAGAAAEPVAKKQKAVALN